jgi:integrase
MTKTDTLNRIRDVLRRQGKSVSTEKQYCGWASRYIDWVCRHGHQFETSEQKAEGFLTMLARDRDVSASTQNGAFYALIFVYAEVWGQALKDVDALRAKRPTHQRIAPTRDEVCALASKLADTEDVPARFITLLMYGTGMRINETLNLRLKDIQFASRGEPVTKNRIIIREPKHGADRTVMIPQTLIGQMQQQVDHARHVCARQMKRWPGVPLQVPHALAKKYPRSAFSESWAFLFPAPRPLRHPRTNEPTRWRIMDESYRVHFRAAKEAAGILGDITPHCMRHGFGTHFEGDLRDLQELMGHKSLETTMVYRHPEIERTVSPLDRLALLSA